MSTSPLRMLPSVHALLGHPVLEEISMRQGREQTLAAARAELAALRGSISSGQRIDCPELETIVGYVANRLGREAHPKLRRVINATGIVLHTNLGRAPMAEAAAMAAAEAAMGYLNLEMDLETGKRSSRQDAVREWLCRLTGAESGTAVNNNAAATVLALHALCRGREVIVSRGQLVEIGGSFRIPEIMATAGVRLREVGTTNITRIADYEQAIGPETAALLRVHPSNYRISGFVASTTLEELVELGRRRGLPVIDDAGSGALVDFDALGLPDEPRIQESVRLGADLVLFSGDKLLGGPQSGLIVGKAEFVEKIQKDPLTRAMRLDKMALAALEATLRIYLQANDRLPDLPLFIMLSTPLGEIESRARALAASIDRIPGIKHVEAVPTSAYIGGGSLPERELPSWAVKLQATTLGEEDLAKRLRMHVPATVGRIADSSLILDVRTIFRQQEAQLLASIEAALRCS